MSNQIMNFFKKKKNQTVLVVLAIALVLAYIINPELIIPVTTGSMFGLFGTALTLSLVIIGVGVFLILIPKPITTKLTITMLGIIMVSVGILVGGYSFVEGINNIIPGFPLATYGLYALITFTGYKFFKRWTK